PAAAALGVAYRHAQHQKAPDSGPARPVDVDIRAARAIVDAALAERREWLTPDEVYALLSAYRLPVCPQLTVHGVKDALRAAANLGSPLAVKRADAAAHKSELGGVRLGIANDAQLRAAVRDLHAISAGPVLLQA